MDERPERSLQWTEIVTTISVVHFCIRVQQPMGRDTTSRCVGILPSEPRISPEYRSVIRRIGPRVWPVSLGLQFWPRWPVANHSPASSFSGHSYRTMSRLSSSLKALINSPAARPGTVPASRNTQSVYQKIQQSAQSNNVSQSSWLALSVRFPPVSQKPIP